MGNADLKSRFIRMSRAQDEYFGGDWDLFAEVGLARQLLVFARLASTPVRIAPLGNWTRPDEPERAGYEKVRLTGYHPIGWLESRYLFTEQQAPVSCLYSRDHSECTQDNCKAPRWYDVAPNKEMDRLAWVHRPRYDHLLHLDTDNAWVGRSHLQRAIDAHLGGGATVPARGWPWGGYETALLRHLAATADRYWKNYDPTEPDTAETKKTVVAWLIGRGVPERTAEAIDTILRAENLPKGPRRKR